VKWGRPTTPGKLFLKPKATFFIIDGFEKPVGMRLYAGALICQILIFPTLRLE